MAAPTKVNPQVTDSVTSSNTMVLGSSPAMAASNLQQATAQAMSNGAQNATTAQQQAAILHQAATTVGATILFSIDTASVAKGTSVIYK